jgi:thiol:disulfide interchange protein DsbA
MNCATIDTLLDEHRTTSLSPADRHSVVAHLAACARCTDSWAVHDALLGEDMGAPPPELVARVQRLAAETTEQPRRRYGVPTLLVAAAAIAAVGVLVVRPWSMAPDSREGAPVAAAAAAPAFVAGRHYEVLARPTTALAAARVPVIEFFMWPCVHCYALEPELDSWAARTADAVALSRVPAIFNPQAEMLARAFYTADALGKGPAMHTAFYDEIHTRGNPLTSREAVAELFARFDVDAAAFDAAFDSPAVDARVREAAALGREYGISAVPTLVVAGRYATNAALAGDRVLAVVDELVADERRASGCAAAATAPSGDDSAYCALRNRR